MQPYAFEGIRIFGGGACTPPLIRQYLLTSPCPAVGGVNESLLLLPLLTSPCPTVGSVSEFFTPSFVLWYRCVERRGGCSGAGRTGWGNKRITDHRSQRFRKSLFVICKYSAGFSQIQADPASKHVTKWSVKINEDDQKYSNFFLSTPNVCICYWNCTNRNN